MKLRLSLLLLCIALFLSAQSISALAEIDYDNDFFLYVVEDQAFSVAMAYWQEGIDSSYTTIAEPVYWQAAGWYAAKMFKTASRELISRSEVEDFLDSVGYKGEMNLPQSWEEYEIVKIIRGAGGSLLYDFKRNKAGYEARIGVDAEVEVKPENRESVIVVITLHAPQGDKLLNYRVSFSPNENRSSRFPYRVSSVEPFSPYPEIDKKLGFTWEDLLEKNRLSNILDHYPCVVITTPMISSHSCTSLFRHNGKFVWVNDNYGNLYGKIDRYSFDYRYYPDGKDRDRIWLDYATGWGSTERYVFERDTLILREILSVNDGEDPWPIYDFICTQDVPDYDFLKGWDGNLRTVTAIWEDHDRINGGFEYRTETIFLPMDWEYLPHVVQSGGYSAYQDPRYTETYAYPGDNMDYTVFFKAEE